MFFYQQIKNLTPAIINCGKLLRNSEYKQKRDHFATGAQLIPMQLSQ